MGTRTDTTHQTLLILMAANDEALRAGHSQVDVDHLLLGLLVVDGDAAHALITARVGLAQARQALAAQERDDVRALGLDDALANEHWVPPVPLKYAADLLPFTVAAKAVVKDHRRWRETDLTLLEQLLADPEASVPRLLSRLGVDGAAVLTAAPSSDRKGRSSSGGRYVQVEVTVPVSAGALWATVADPARRPEWDDDAGVVQVLDEHTFAVTPRFMVELASEGRAGRLPEVSVTYHVIDQTPGRFVEWELLYPPRKGRESHSERQSIEITSVDGGSRLTLTASRSRSRNVLVRRLWNWTGGQELRVRAQALAQVS
ncbi:MAG: hypothetical protein L0H96_17470 [Humibacillus sp.]|nr:hypothetical protein [Humibacillus sp.]MDN5778687.1 hypothetical protein [Humibacillus sp.]